MKPILVFFAKPRDAMDFNKKSKDSQVNGTIHYEKEVFGRLAIAELTKEFICIKVNIKKADKRLLAKTYGVTRAPVVQILDFYGKQVYRLVSPKLSWRHMGKFMEKAIKKVEREVKRLAKSKEDTPIVQRAKVRANEIDMRDGYNKGLDYTYKRKWARAEKEFQAVLDNKAENQWKKKAENGMMELKAGKLFVEAERMEKKRRYSQAKELLDKVVRINQSKY
jgi:tetratricopeptide (TPR) repeat protein